MLPERKHSQNEPRHEAIFVDDVKNLSRLGIDRTTLEWNIKIFYWL